MDTTDIYGFSTEEHLVNIQTQLDHFHAKFIEYDEKLKELGDKIVANNVRNSWNENGIENGIGSLPPPMTGIESIDFPDLSYPEKNDRHVDFSDMSSNVKNSSEPYIPYPKVSYNEPSDFSEFRKFTWFIIGYFWIWNIWL